MSLILIIMLLYGWGWVGFIIFLYNDGRVYKHKYLWELLFGLFIWLADIFIICQNILDDYKGKD